MKKIKCETDKKANKGKEEVRKLPYLCCREVFQPHSVLFQGDAMQRSQDRVGGKRTPEREGNTAPRSGWKSRVS